MPAARIAAINLECSDPAVLAAFQAAALGGEGVVETPDFCAVKVDSLDLGAVRVEDYRPPTWPSAARSQQLHLDLAVEDLDSAEDKALRLGATKETEQPTPDRSRVIRTQPATRSACGYSPTRTRGRVTAAERCTSTRAHRRRNGRPDHRCPPRRHRRAATSLSALGKTTTDRRAQVGITDVCEVRALLASVRQRPKRDK